MSSTSGLTVEQKATALLEDSAVHWQRDYDAVLIGLVLGLLVGVLGTLIVQGTW